MFWARRRRKARLKAGSHLLEITEDALVKSRLESALVCAKGGIARDGLRVPASKGPQRINNACRSRSAGGVGVLALPHYIPDLYPAQASAALACR